jgi:hypothetical protein
MKPTPVYEASRAAAIAVRSRGERLQTEHYWLDPDARSLKTEDERDHHAGAESAGCYHKRFAAMDDEARYTVARIYTHACEYYERGWDMLVECIDPTEILEFIGDERDVQKAIVLAARGAGLSIYNDVRNDALAAGDLETTEFEMGLSNEAETAWQSDR